MRETLKLLSGTLKCTALVTGLLLPVWAQTDAIPGTPETETTAGPRSVVVCNVPEFARQDGTTAAGAPETIGIIGTSAFADPFGDPDEPQQPTLVNCNVPGVGTVPQNLLFSAEAPLPLGFVLAPIPPTLPVDLFTAVREGRAELRQFLTLSGRILTLSLAAVEAGLPLPMEPVAATPPGTLITQVRIQVHNLLVAGGQVPSMLLSGVVLAPPATPINQVVPINPELFGDLTGRAASVALAFAAPIRFPGLEGAPLTGAIGTGLDELGMPQPAPLTMITMQVAGAFVMSSPNGVATLAFPDVPPGLAPVAPPLEDTPVIVLSHLPGTLFQRRVVLDASQSFDPGGLPLTFTWQAPAGLVGITGAETPVATLEFFRGGTHIVQLTVTNQAGVSSVARFPIVVFGP